MVVASNELEAFNCSVAHDLRGSLRGINGFSQALSEDYGAQPDASALAYLQQIRTGTQKMGQLIDDLLALSQVNRHEILRSEIDLQGRDRARQVKWTIQPGVRAQGDPNLLRVALQNLLENAWKFTSKRAMARITFGVPLQEDLTVDYLRDSR